MACMDEANEPPSVVPPIELPPPFFSSLNALHCTSYLVLGQTGCLDKGDDVETNHEELMHGGSTLTALHQRVAIAWATQ